MKANLIAMALSLSASLVLAQEAAAPKPAAAGVAGTTQAAGTRLLKLDAAPSAMMDWPLDRWKPIGEAMEAELARELAQPEPLSAARWRELQMWSSQLAQLRGDWALVKAPIERVRRSMEQPAQRLTAGVLTELIAEQQIGRHGEPWLRKATAQRFAAMPWSEVEKVVRSSEAQLRAANADGLKQQIASQYDGMVAGTEGRVTTALVMRLIGARLQLAHTLPHRAALADGLADVIARQSAAGASGAAR